MSCGNYTHEPNKYQRRILAILATAQIMQGDELEYSGLLMEDVRARMPHGKRDRTAMSSAMRALIDANYVTLGPRRQATGASDQVGLFQSYRITSQGLRVALGVLG